MSYFYVNGILSRLFCHLRIRKKVAQSYKKLSEETVPNVGHGRKTGQNQILFCLCVFVVFPFIPLVFYSLFI